jgi:hypothetical protein
MPSDSHRHRNVPNGGPKPKCKQCGTEKALPSRNDGLGQSCGTYKDKSQKIAAEHAERAAKAKK